MISNQILQKTIDGLAQITKVGFAVYDLDGDVLASTIPEPAEYVKPVVDFATSPAESQVVFGCQLYKIFDDLQPEFVLLSKGEGEDSTIIGKVAAFQIRELLVAYKERFDRDNLDIR